MWAAARASFRRSPLPVRGTTLSRAWASSSSATREQPQSSSSVASLKRLVQPFVLKCHPDMARQQGLPESSKKVNLSAIQNLNSYLDGVRKMMKPGKGAQPGPYPFPRESETVEIDFVMSMAKQPSEAGKHNKAGQKHVVSTSRRKVELLVPPMDATPAGVRRHATRQFLRLLRISDLPAPVNLSLEEDYEDGGEDGHREGERPGSGPPSNRHRRRPMTPWESSRERFWKRHNRAFDPKKFKRIYQEALGDAEVHLRTRNWIRDNPRLRHRLLAKVLSNVRFTESISPLERLVAYRRLMRFLDENFDELRLEDAGRYWEEQTTLLVAEARPRHLSPAFLRKRRKRNKHVETGYSFTIHHDNTVTVTIPADFDHDELLEELLRNMADVAQSTAPTSGLEGDFYSAMYGHDAMV
ncbi:unnamed protein product [Pseudo-nitzschia multistriata]|uniref:DUF4460 domain-containing protein n=1 Tax=Pseudo-nitzschia multistriata TaxID=183589 RepID=A0A448ZGQ0_9STRA|nr:unnamed protein product [Pseudo-nitzschia multistriata]